MTYQLTSAQTVDLVIYLADTMPNRMIEQIGALYRASGLGLRLCRDLVEAEWARRKGSTRTFGHIAHQPVSAIGRQVQALAMIRDFY